jgi:hypothetical protein
MADLLLCAVFLAIIFTPAVLAGILHSRSHNGKI